MLPRLVFREHKLVRVHLYGRHRPQDRWRVGVADTKQDVEVLAGVVSNHSIQR